MKGVGEVRVAEVGGVGSGRILLVGRVPPVVSRGIFGRGRDCFRLTNWFSVD